MQEENREDEDSDEENATGDEKPAVEYVAQMGENPLSIKLGKAYREFYCCYCDFTATSKFQVKQHSLATHPGMPLEVADFPNSAATAVKNNAEIEAAVC